MKLAFIVNLDGDGAKIVTPLILSKEIRFAIKEKTDRVPTVKVKQCDIDSFAGDAVREYAGTAMSGQDYNSLIESAVVALEGYSSLTPYEYSKTLI